MAGEPPWQGFLTENNVNIFLYFVQQNLPYLNKRLFFLEYNIRKKNLMLILIFRNHAFVVSRQSFLKSNTNILRTTITFGEWKWEHLGTSPNGAASNQSSRCQPSRLGQWCDANQTLEHIISTEPCPHRVTTEEWLLAVIQCQWALQAPQKFQDHANLRSKVFS